MSPSPTHGALCPPRIARRHLLMLAMAVEVLVLGAINADRVRRPGITVEQTVTQGHVIT
ncbi:hypothetical protein [Methylobacterium sp. Leaf118]|uniref:hypothetical protein n=1 Tax=Methylobacterium sp. Leaf118 TaxID=2876562 RepID=UPI001E37A52A|nr:hypothetical protein [Methylobacterium sp. Leaf118]